MKYVAVTGCRGFLGHHLVRYLLDRDYYVLGIDAETYAAIHPTPLDHTFHYVKADIGTLDHLPDVEAVINCAAETHVDNSLGNSRPFLTSNVFGVWNLLELVRAKRAFQMPLFLQVSTDEVLGSVGEGTLGPEAPLRPMNPYAASKAAAEVLVQAWGHTHALPWTIVRPTNLYGTGQYPEKLIPKTIRSLALGRAMPIHGDGSASRQWLWVEDACQGIERLLSAPTGRIYQMGGDTEATVKAVAERLCTLMGKPTSQLAYGYTRQALDQRYGLDDTALRAVGWTPRGRFWDILSTLVEVEKNHWRW